MKRCRRMIAILLMAAVAGSALPQRAEAAGLSKKAYAIVKGQWWFQSSSGGNDARFTKNKIKYYNRKNYKVERTAAIKKCVKTKRGYVVCVKDGKVKYSYTIPFEGRKKKEYQLWFHGSWKPNANDYSGSSSLNRGKWESR